MAIASLGLAGILSDGGSDDVEQDDAVNDEIPETEPQQENIIEVAPEAEQPATIEETVTPVTPTQDAVAEDATDINAPETTPFSPPPVILPPAPLTLPEMVLVTTSEEDEVADELVLTEGPETGEDQDRSYIVTAPEEAHTIELGYHTDTTLAVTPNDQTTRISASLNTNIHGGESTEITTTEEIETNQGGTFTETVITKEYDNDVNIVLNVDQSQIGSHVAQIDLSNPEDSLRFKFTNLRGFMHMITNEEETSDDDGITTHTTRTLYVIETSLDVPELDPSEIGRIIADDGALDSGTQLVAEVHLGTSSLAIHESGGVVTSQTITDFTNESPTIRSNFYWASESEYDGGAVTTSSDDDTTSGSTSQLATFDGF